MAEREYFMGPKIGTQRHAVLENVGSANGWLCSLLDQRMEQILNLPENLDPNLIVKIKVIDNP